MARRGMLTEDIQAVARERLGYEITTLELRLMPYLLFTMTDSGKLDPKRINAEERKALAKWREQGHIEGGAGGLGMSKEFWDTISEILWLGYATCD